MRPGDAVASPGGGVFPNIVGQKLAQSAFELFQALLRIKVELSVRIRVEKLFRVARKSFNGSEKAEDVTRRMLGLQRPGFNLLVRRGGFVLETCPFGNPGGARRFDQDRVQLPLYQSPSFRILILFATRLKTVPRRHRIRVELIPFDEQCPISTRTNTLFDFSKFPGGDVRWQRSPAITLPQQDNKIRTRRRALAAAQFLQTDGHRLLV